MRNFLSAPLRIMRKTKLHDTDMRLNIYIYIYIGVSSRLPSDRTESKR